MPRSKLILLRSPSKNIVINLDNHAKVIEITTGPPDLQARTGRQAKNCRCHPDAFVPPPKVDDAKVVTLLKASPPEVVTPKSSVESIDEVDSVFLKPSVRSITFEEPVTLRKDEGAVEAAVTLRKDKGALEAAVKKDNGSKKKGCCSWLNPANWKKKPKEETATVGKAAQVNAAPKRKVSVEDQIETAKNVTNVEAAPPSSVEDQIETAKFVTTVEAARPRRQLSDTFKPPTKVYLYGEKGSGFRTKGEPQDFYTLRSECLQRGELYEDPEFLAKDSSLFFSQRPDRRFEWKRPGELVDNPQLFVEGFSRFDVQQGELGDCWLLAAVANLTLYRRLFFQIVPDDQSFEENYAGIFHFRFWQYGKWIDVVIDDRLPTYRGELVFLHSTEVNEFWSALLEKAYAKMHGSYEALKGGSTCEAMEDFTGGVTEMYELESSPPNLFKIISKAYERWSLMGCSIEPDPSVVEAQTPEGLIRGHAYSITKVQYVNIQTPNTSGKIPLLRLRNPWGNESEWTGAWSDNSPEWRYIDDNEKEKIGLTFDADGEFWMSFKDFQTYFSRIEICNLNPDSLADDELTEGRNKKWEMSVFEGEWVRGVTAGGCRNFLETFWHNPQYRVTLTEVDEGEEENKCTMIVALMQKNRRQIRQQGVDLLTVGFAIYYLPYPDQAPKPLDVQFFKYNASVARSPSFINLREVSCRFKLPPGTYCIVPSTFDPNEEGEFLLRVFSEHQNNMEYDGSYSDYLRSHNEVEDDRHQGSSDDETPSYPPPSPPAAPHSENPSNPPFPSYPGYPSSYPQNPYPSSGYGQYPYPQPSQPYPQPSQPYSQPYPQPSQPYPPQYPQYPQYPDNSGESSRRQPKKDPIVSFFKGLFR